MLVTLTGLRVNPYNTLSLLLLFVPVRLFWFSFNNTPNLTCANLLIVILLEECFKVLMFELSLLLLKTRRSFPASNKSQVETIEEEVFTETKRDVPDVTDSCQGDNDPEPASVLSEADSPSELNENVISFAAMRSMSAGIGSWRSATSTSNWGMVCETFPQLNLLLGFLKVNIHLQH